MPFKIRLDKGGPSRYGIEQGQGFGPGEHYGTIPVLLQPLLFLGNPEE